MKKWATLSRNYPTCHLCGLWFSCNNLWTTSFELAYHPWCIGEYTQLCPIVLFIFVTPFYFKLVCNLGFKTKFQGCSRKGGHENRSEYGTITPNGNTQHFIFKCVKHTFEYILVSTCLCYLFPFICVFFFKIYGLQQAIIHCSLLVLNLDTHESI
jgi:hypothetical protein